MAFRWNNPAADVFRGARFDVAFAGGVPGAWVADQLFGSPLVAGGEAVAAAVVLGAWTPRLSAPGTLPVAAVVGGALRWRFAAGGAAVAAARVAGTFALAGVTDLGELVFEAPPPDPLATLLAYVPLGATLDEHPARDPPARLVGDYGAAWRPVVWDRTPRGRLGVDPTGDLMLYRKQFDVAGDLVLQLARVLDGVATAAPELDGALAVTLRRRAPSGAVVRSPLTVLDLGRGLVGAPLGAPALAEAGMHALTVEITTAAGRVTYPHQGAVTLVVEPVGAP